MKKTSLLPVLTMGAWNHRKTQHHFPTAPARLWTALCLGSLLTAATPTARAAVSEAWVHRYSNVVSNSNDWLAKAVCDAAGDIIVTGFTDGGTTGLDILTIKYSGANGSVIWQKRYNGPGNSDDVATAVAVDGSGNVVVTGSSGEDFYTSKYAGSDGALLWQKRYTYGQATALAVDGSGNVVVTGHCSGTNFDADYYTAKYAGSDGALLWEHRYNGSANYDDNARAVAVDGSGNVVVTGSSGALNDDGDLGSDYYTAKYAAADGALLWEKRYNGPANSSDEARSVAIDGSDNVVVTGFSHNAITTDEFGNSHSDTDYYTAKYASADGALLWERRYNGPACSCNANRPDYATAVALDRNGNVVVTGASGWENGFGLFLRFYTAKYAAADGALLWEKRADLGDQIDGARAVAIDDSGNVVVTGYSAGGYTAKYAAADGALLWEKRYNGPANGNDTTSSLALGPNGIVAITGASDGGYVTIVYWENLPPVALERVPTGVRLQFLGIPGRTYNIERALAITGPWTTLATPVSPLNGLIVYMDINPPAGTAFYRTSTP